MILLDTSGLLCCFDEGDARNGDAARIVAAAPTRVTHSYVLAEFVPLCRARNLNPIRVLAAEDDGTGATPETLEGLQARHAKDAAALGRKQAREVVALGLGQMAELAAITKRDPTEGA